MKKKICLITGVGPGTGAALVRRYAQAGFAVAMVARNAERLKQLELEITDSKGFACDVSDLVQIKNTVQKVKEKMGVPDVIIHNAVGSSWGDFLSIEPEVLQQNFQINTMALLHLGQLLAPDMLKRGSGSIICTGNTSAYRGKANFAGFAPTKAAQRILAESMARTLGPLGIHVAYIAIDAVINVPWARKRFSDKPDDFFSQPNDIAEECFRISQQVRSAWSFNVEIRPYAENW